MQPESSDGFASVGTILPKEKAAPLPGGFLAFWSGFWSARMGRSGPANRDFGLRCDDATINKREADADSDAEGALARKGKTRRFLPEARMHDFVIGLLFVAMVMTPCVVALTTPLDEGDRK
jgi:hypothetical protein